MRQILKIYEIKANLFKCVELGIKYVGSPVLSQQQLWFRDALVVNESGAIISWDKGWMRHTSVENSDLDWVNEWVQQKIKQLVNMNGPGMTGGVGGRTDYTESPGRRSQVSRALVGEGNQDAESPRRRTRVSRGHLTGSIVCHHPKENPVLLVKSVHINFYDKQMLVCDIQSLNLLQKRWWREC